MKAYLKDHAEIIIDQNIKGDATLKIPLDFALGLKVGDILVFGPSVSIDDQLRFFASLD